MEQQTTTLPDRVELLNAKNQLAEAHKNITEVGEWAKGNQQTIGSSVLTDLYFQMRSIENLIYFFQDLITHIDGETSKDMVQSDTVQS